MSEQRKLNRVIILNCFGRGGSSILWNMIGSSPDVLMPNSEWHQGFYGSMPVLGRALRKVTRPWNLDVPALPGLRPLVAARAHAAIPEREWARKPEATASVVKLMDHHISMNGIIEGAFRASQQVVLARHPVAQCESLSRSGLNLEQSVAWYVDVCERFLRLMKQRDVHLIKFEDMVRDPFAVRDGLYEQLRIRVPESGNFRIKRKKFGDARTANDMAVGDYAEVTPKNVAEMIDAKVNEKSLARVPMERQDYIWAKAGALAEQFGYQRETAANSRATAQASDVREEVSSV